MLHLAVLVLRLARLRWLVLAAMAMATVRVLRRTSRAPSLTALPVLMCLVTTRLLSAALYLMVLHLMVSGPTTLRRRRMSLHPRVLATSTTTPFSTPPRSRLLTPGRTSRMSRLVRVTSPMGLMFLKARRPKDHRPRVLATSTRVLHSTRRRSSRLTLGRMFQTRTTRV